MKTSYTVTIVGCAILAIALNLQLTQAHSAEIYAHVPAGHNLVIGVDVQAALDSVLFAKIETEVKFGRIQQKLDELENWTGFDAREDLRQVYLSGVTGQDDAGCVYLEGKFDVNALLSVLEFNETYSEELYKGMPVEYWIDKNDGERFACFVRNDLLAIAGRQSTIEQVIDAGEDNSLAFMSRLNGRKLPPAAKSPVWIVVAAADDMPEKIRQNPVLSKLTFAQVQLELDPSVHATINGQTNSAEDAQATLDVLNGLIALGKMSDTKPVLNALAQHAKVFRQQNEIELSLQLDHQLIEPLLVQKIRVKQLAESRD